MDQSNMPIPGKGQAIASLVLGILSLVGICVPLLNLIMGIVGLALAAMSKKERLCRRYSHSRIRAQSAWYDFWSYLLFLFCYVRWMCWMCRISGNLGSLGILSGFLLEGESREGSVQQKLH